MPKNAYYLISFSLEKYLGLWHIYIVIENKELVKQAHDYLKLYSQ